MNASIFSPKVVLNFCAFLGMLLVFLTPPFQVPDEQFHFYRSYQISMGHFVSQTQDFETGDTIPSSLSRLASVFMNGVTAQRNGKLRMEQIQEGFSIDLDSEHNIFTPFTNPSLYTPLAYLGSVPLVMIGRLLNFRPIFLFYLGRVGNYLLAMFLLLAAFKYYSSGNWITLGWLMIPTNAFLRSSLSPEGLFNSCVAFFLTVALLLREPEIESSVRKRLTWLLVLVGAFIISYKQVYWLIPLLLIPLNSRGFIQKHIYQSLGIIYGIGLISNFFWIQVSKESYNSMVIGNDLTAQLQFVKSNPMIIATIIGDNFAKFWPDYLRTMTGVIGWIDVYLPYEFTIAYILFMLFLLLAANKPISNCNSKVRIVFNVASTLTCVGVVLAIYISGMPVGAGEVLGVQGRYFLAPFLLAMFANSTPLLEEYRLVSKAVPIAVLFFSVSSYLVIFYSMFVRYC